MRTITISSSQLAEHKRWDAGYWVRLHNLPDTTIEAAQQKYVEQMAKARVLRDEAQTLIRKARLLEADVAPLRKCIRRNR